MRNAKGVFESEEPQNSEFNGSPDSGPDVLIIETASRQEVEEVRAEMHRYKQELRELKRHIKGRKNGEDPPTPTTPDFQKRLEVLLRAYVKTRV
ncbi:hypothetical protein [Hymenobacter wooponensis]|uniref:Uncharacterized protein n=1 Tax=Hymenobacter wooponensis TaxID=1525360 RepID=A0A4Z0MN22_9BACT|nr:hypothetical protein [Hymenobacter wooponensis]TGD81292.1 hypothetical protein EU557_06915 [Hymenobacter wooponensis]